MIRNFDKFEVGHWYVFTGTEEDAGVKNWIELKKELLDHKPAKCTDVVGDDAVVSFDRIVGGNWSYNQVKNLFIEVEDPNVKQVCNVGDYYCNKFGINVFRSSCGGKLELNEGCETYKLSRPPLEKWGINVHRSETLKDNDHMIMPGLTKSQKECRDLAAELGITVKMAKEFVFPFRYSSQGHSTQLSMYANIDPAKWIHNVYTVNPSNRRISWKRKAQLKPSAERMRDIK